MREARTLVLTWFAAVGLITLAIVPIRLYVLSANDWLVGALSTLALVFLAIYFLVAWIWKPKAGAPSQDSGTHMVARVLGDVVGFLSVTSLLPESFRQMFKC